jgi:Glucose-6-phosphate dehydrogenase subunit
MRAATRSPEWSGDDVGVADLERRLAELEHRHGDGTADLRTSVMTHLAWVPREWERAAFDTLAGLAERHPSRGIVLLPDPDADVDRIDAHLSLHCSALADHEGVNLCTEVIQLRLRGRRAAAPASVVAPLLIADLPVFLRWRGRPPFRAHHFRGLLDLADRLIVDSGEWDDVPADYSAFVGLFERAACSDIAWGRSERWRLALASLWPGIAELDELRVRGPLADALLLVGWLRSRLGRDVELVHTPADTLDAIEVDGRPVPSAATEPPTASDLLSGELDTFVRDRVYEEAVGAARDVAPVVASTMGS